MIKRSIVLVLFYFLLSRLILYSAEIEISTSEPKLLWQKEFKTDINSVAISSDGTKIAILLEPELKRTVKDERYYKGVRREWGSGKLIYLDKDGNILWEYEHEKEKGNNMLSDISMSEDGKYIACSVIEMRDEGGSYKTFENAGGIEIPKEYKTIYQRWEYKEVLYFNSKGELLWKFKAKGKAKVSERGNYIAIIPAEDEHVPLDDFYFFGKNGEVLWKKEFKKEFPPEEVPPIDITRDGKKIIIGDTLYNAKGEIVWKLEKGYFGGISEDGKLVTVHIPIEPHLYDLNLDSLKEVKFIRLSSKKVLYTWRKKSGKSYLTKEDISSFSPPKDLLKNFVLYYYFLNFPQLPEDGFSDRNISIVDNGRYFIISRLREYGEYKELSKWKTKIYFYTTEGDFKWSLVLSGGSWVRPFVSSPCGKYILIYLQKKLYFYDNRKYIK
ncbi:MAG: hypothetical protein DRI36_02670 [Caldiserica bacterium]|nr:MAG: hypothetical protein DRI36_02670 [Caldisericota bacterium]